ncbi:hypothetical protein YC2023_082391 [Brassica napus]
MSRRRISQVTGLTVFTQAAARGSTHKDWLESASHDSNCLSSIISLSISLSHDESFVDNVTRVRFGLQTEMAEEEKRLRCYLEPLAVALDKEKWSMCVYSK